jgi:hypothetical protein
MDGATQADYDGVYRLPLTIGIPECSSYTTANILGVQFDPHRRSCSAR